MTPPKYLANGGLLRLYRGMVLAAITGAAWALWGLNTQVSSLAATMVAVNTALANHESRLQYVERRAWVTPEEE